MDDFEDMKMTLTYTQTFEVGDLTDFQLQTFSGDIEIVGHDENTIKVETFIWDRNLYLYLESPTDKPTKKFPPTKIR